MNLTKIIITKLTKTLASEKESLEIECLSLRLCSAKGKEHENSQFPQVLTPHTICFCKGVYYDFLHCVGESLIYMKLRGT